MYIELIAIIVAGIGTGGLVLVVNRLTGRRLPRFAVPLAAALAMFAYALWSEYTWGTRTVASLPEGVVEVTHVDQAIPWKPWTLLAPVTTRVMAANRIGVQSRPDAPEVRLVELYLLARWHSARTVMVLIDCAAPARADATDAALTDPSVADWQPLGPADPLLRAVCVPPE
ncbi:hypothetical protein CCR90_00780 [Rhodovulum sulfidophilum]|uniref:hypothetical protein n=1 Tax=Rhodovulum sulfidophilum TaxID=35806 RepID=UPI0019115BF8|nr:hypothetical protein [Rhodovulum sulfidophilum]MBK5922330.1 hypothetical protein [Rhodovulum sulfidophilum]